jgi:hypothetical protein
MSVWVALLRAGRVASITAACCVGLAQAQPVDGASAPAPAPASLPAPAASSSLSHRPLRNNLPPYEGLPKASVPEVFSGYANAPAFSVAPRKQNLLLYPCSMCHNLLKLNTEVRTLRVPPDPAGAPHQAELRHGAGRLWCLDCHLPKDREWLHTLNGAKVDFDDSAQVCGQCHSARYKDWVFGGHGKRVAGWKGERQLYACTHCHDPHQPKLQPRAAGKPPPLRAGLQPMGGHPEPSTLPWQRAQEGPDRVGKAKP